AMTLNLEGQMALIVGGMRGIGRAIAEAFVAEGSLVMIMDREPGVEETAYEIGGQQGKGGAGFGFLVDATDYSAVLSAKNGLSNWFDKGIHLVYAAAVGSGKFGFPYWNLVPADWERVWNVNVMGAVNFAHAFGPVMAEMGRGTMLFIASV